MARKRKYDPEKRRAAYLRDRERARARGAAYYQKNREKIRQWHAANYVKNAEAINARNSNYKKRNWDTIGPRRRQQRLELKIRAFQSMGGRCECCGEREIHFLAMDHINGGGRKHVGSLGGSVMLYPWVLKNPEEAKAMLRVLCHNCNHAVAVNGGVCPHQYGPRLVKSNAD